MTHVGSQSHKKKSHLLMALQTLLSHTEYSTKILHAFIMPLSQATCPTPLTLIPMIVVMTRDEQKLRSCLRYSHSNI